MTAETVGAAYAVIATKEVKVVRAEVVVDVRRRTPIVTASPSVVERRPGTVARSRKEDVITVCL